MKRPEVLTASMTLLLTLTGLAWGQTPAPANPPADSTAIQREGRPVRRRLRMQRRRLALASALNLSEDQKKQGLAIRQKYLATTRSQRQQLFDLREKRMAGTLTAEDRERMKALRGELRTSMLSMRDELISGLTPDQRTQLDTLREQRKQRRLEMMKRRRELLQSKPIG